MWWAFILGEVEAYPPRYRLWGSTKDGSFVTAYNEFVVLRPAGPRGRSNLTSGMSRPSAVGSIENKGAGSVIVELGSDEDQSGATRPIRQKRAREEAVPGRASKQIRRTLSDQLFGDDEESMSEPSKLESLFSAVPSLGRKGIADQSRPQLSGKGKSDCKRDNQDPEDDLPLSNVKQRRDAEKTTTSRRSPFDSLNQASPQQQQNTAAPKEVAPQPSAQPATTSKSLIKAYSAAFKHVATQRKPGETLSVVRSDLKDSVQELKAAATDGDEWSFNEFWEMIDGRLDALGLQGLPDLAQSAT